MNKNWVFLNNEFCLEDKALLPISNRGFLFGEGIFTSIRVFQGKMEFWPLHLKRLQQQAQFLNFYLPHLNIENALELIQRNQAQEGNWKLKIIITFKQDKKEADQVLMTLSPYLNDLCSYRLLLFPQPVLNPLAPIKSLSYLPYLHMKKYAQEKGYDDAVIQSPEKFLLETSCSNLFWIEKEACYIPDLALPYLKGVLLQVIQSHLQMPLFFVKKNIDQVPAQAALYLCNALLHVKPVTAFNHRIFARQLETEKILQQTILEAVKRF